MIADGLAWMQDSGLTPAICGPFVRSTDNHWHLHQVHRAWKLERNARPDLDWKLRRARSRATEGSAS